MCYFVYFVANSYDVRTGTYRLNFYSSVSTLTVKVAIRDDKLVEGLEAFGVQLILYDYCRPCCLKLGVPSVTTVFIKDDTYTPSVGVLIYVIIFASFKMITQLAMFLPDHQPNHQHNLQHNLQHSQQHNLRHNLQHSLQHNQQHSLVNK